ncbi:MAG: DUF4956 domain-containing protein [Nitriliruptorales bacterium]|nr:DUF4956 domain-containing protein [Nitriliruptorales bacterium]
MTQTVLILIDLVAVATLVLAVYLPRHRRTEMVVAYLGINVGTLAVANALASAEVSAGLALGLFGVLSIIRLRSLELDQPDVAYYFAALALGLLGGIATSPAWLAPVLMAAVVAALWVGDHPRIARRTVHQRMRLDRAHTDDESLVAHLEDLLGTEVVRTTVRRIDLVRDTTDVDVRFLPPQRAATTASTSEQARSDR